MNAHQTRIEAFLARVSAMGLHSTGQPNYRLYGDLKRDLERDHPGLHPSVYDRVIAAISRATGV